MTDSADDTMLKVERLGRDFDVSRPWLNRVLEGEPRRCDIRDSAILELHADVRNILKRGEHIHADGIKAGYLGLYAHKYDVQVMDHEIKHDAAVIDAAGEWPEAVDLKEANIFSDLFDTFETGIMTFDMTNLKGAMMLTGQGEEFICFFQF